LTAGDPAGASSPISQASPEGWDREVAFWLRGDLRRRTPWRVLAVVGVILVLAAVAAVFVGNFLRICSSVVAALYAGKPSLVLFHDWVGSMIGFAFTLGGFVLMLWILLPARGTGPIPSLETEGGA
jgi:exosortase/archaeosortase family protein